MIDTALTLISNPAAPAIDDAVLAAVKEELARLGLASSPARTLAPGVAVDYRLAVDGEIKALATAIKARLGDAALDVAAVPAAGRRKRILVADMDSTIIEQECLDELADFAGLKAEIAAVTERAMRGELDFETALLQRVGRLAGLPADALAETFRSRITLTPGAVTLVATMRAAGGYAALVSGGFTYFTSRVAAAAGFDDHRANELLIAEGALVGDVGRPILGREAKAETLRAVARAQGVAPADCLAVGDGANDLSMLASAGMGVAFRAKPAVAAAADVAINHGDLTALLYLQGFAREAFAPAR